MVSYDWLNDIEFPLTNVIAFMEYCGVKVDIPYLRKLDQEFAEEQAGLETDLKMALGVINLNSPQQKAQALKAKGIKLAKRTSTGRLSTARATLEALAKKGIPEAKALLEYSEIQKLRSAFTSVIPDRVNPITGRVHSSFNQTIVITGRLSSSNPINLQQIPVRTTRGRKIRRAFIAEPGYALVKADQSQAELRILAHLSQDENMLKAFRDGEDIHGVVCKAIFGNRPDYEERYKFYRYIAKQCSFCTVYGGGPAKIAELTGITRAEASRVQRRYFTSYPQVAEWIEEQKELIASTPYVHTVIGRPIFIADALESGSKFSNARREAVNYQIQGTNADLLKIAMLRVFENLPKDAKIVLQVHDELVLEVPEARIDEASEVLKWAMTDYDFLSVQMVADVVVGQNWAEVKD
jgi:DNA polymerase-1